MFFLGQDIYDLSEWINRNIDTKNTIQNKLIFATKNNIEFSLYVDKNGHLCLSTVYELSLNSCNHDTFHSILLKMSTDWHTWNKSVSCPDPKLDRLFSSPSNTEFYFKNFGFEWSFDEYLRFTFWLYIESSDNDELLYFILQLVQCSDDAWNCNLVLLEIINYLKKTSLCDDIINILIEY